MKTSSLYRLEVAPLTILPLSRSPFFSYASLTPVLPGSLVSISFGKQMLEGVVYDCQTLPGAKPTWMKLVTKVLHESYMTDEQRALALMVSHEYFTPLGKTLRHFLPKKSKQKKTSAQSSVTGTVVLRPTKQETAMLVLFNRAKRPTSVDTSFLLDPHKFFALIGKATLKHRQQLLILVPEITLVYTIHERWKRIFSSTVVTLHNKLTPGEYSASWEKIRQGEAQIIIATRQGLFAPFHDLGTIIVTEEQDDSYKQWDMSPRYHGKRVAIMLANLHQAKLLLASGTPSTDSLLGREQELLTPLSPIMNHPPLKGTLTIVNLKLERYHRNFSPLSQTLTQCLQSTLTRGAQALLYINRQGMNAFSICEQCKNTFRCQKCEHPMNNTKEGSFRCINCGFQTPLFPSCPSCGNLSFRHVGFGTESVERAVRKLFPSARTARMDTTTLKNSKAVNKLINDGLKNNIDVLIGTQMALKDPPLPKLALIAMIDADSLLLFPDFRADERLFQDVSRAVHQVTHANKVGLRGAVIVQTFHPESAFLQKIATLSSQEFTSKLLSDRRDLFYPPYTRFVMLKCFGTTEQETSDKALHITTSLKKVLPPGYQLRSPLSARFLKKMKRFECTLLLSFPVSEEFISESVQSTLIHFSQDCVIDVDPISQQ